MALAGAVSDWTRQRCPGEPALARRAVEVALNSLAGGASVAEASEEARAFVVGWMRHPAHPGSWSSSPLPLAS